MGIFRRRQSKRTGLAAGVYASSRGLATAVVAHEPERPPSLAGFHVGTVADPAEGLSRYAREAGLEQVPAAAVMALDECQLLLVEAPGVPAEEMQAAMRWRLKELVDFDIDEAIVDLFPVPERSGGSGDMVYAVIARRELVDGKVRVMRDADLHVSAVDIPELALRNVAGLLPEDVAGVAVLYLDDSRGVITVTRQGVLYLTRRVEVGTAFLRERGAGPLDEATEGWLDGIVIEAQRSLDYYESHFGQPPVSALVLSPLPVAIEGLTDYLSSQLGVRVRTLDIGELIEGDEQVPQEEQGPCLLALGGALRGDLAA